MSPIQAALEAEQAAQCGYCNLGMMMRAQALLTANPRPSEAEMRAVVAANLCRCGIHMRILRTVRRAALAMGGGVPDPAEPVDLRPWTQVVTVEPSRRAVLSGCSRCANKSTASSRSAPQ